MLKYTGKYWLILAPLVRKSLKKHYGIVLKGTAMKKIRPLSQAKIDEISALIGASFWDYPYEEKGKSVFSHGI